MLSKEYQSAAKLLSSSVSAGHLFSAFSRVFQYFRFTGSEDVFLVGLQVLPKELKNFLAHKWTDRSATTTPRFVAQDTKHRIFYSSGCCLL